MPKGRGIGKSDWARERARYRYESTFDESRADAIGQNGPTGDHYMTPEEEELPAQEKHDCPRCGGCYYSPPHDECPCREQVASKYHREIKPGVFVDVYDVLSAWRVENPALQHLIKKALQPGGRGHKTLEQDMADIVASAKRAQEIES